MDMEKLQAKMLSNGMQRGEYIALLNQQYKQPRVTYTAGAKQILDIPYGSASVRQKVDVYIPHGAGPFPVVVWVHGGGWFMGDRSDFGLGYVLPLLEEGFAIASVGYRLADEAVFPAPLQDVLAALALLAVQGEAWQLDAGRMALVSGSAGSTIAALAALQYRPRVKAVVLKCPILEFAAIRAQFEEIGLQRGRFAYPDEDTSIEALFLGGSVQELPKKCSEATPIRYVNREMPPFLLLHGLEDVDTPYLQTSRFANQANKIAGEGRVEAVLLPGTGHDGGMFETTEIEKRQTEYLKKHLFYTTLQ